MTKYAVVTTPIFSNNSNLNRLITQNHGITPSFLIQQMQISEFFNKKSI